MGSVGVPGGRLCKISLTLVLKRRVVEDWENVTQKCVAAFAMPLANDELSRTRPVWQQRVLQSRLSMLSFKAI